MSPTATYIATPTGLVHVWTAGARRHDHAPIVLLHHTPSDGAALHALAEALAPRWTITPDLPGFGASDPLPAGPSVAGWAAAVAVVLARLEIDGAMVFGHHAGAAVAARLAVGYPHRVGRLILSAPPLVDAAGRIALERRIEPPRPPTADGDHIHAAWQRVIAKAPALALDLAHRETVAALAAGAGYVDAYRAVLNHDLAADLAAVRVPTLVTTAPDDPLAPLAPRAAALARAAYVPLPAGDLHVCATAPAAVAALFALAPLHPDEDP